MTSATVNLAEAATPWGSAQTWDSPVDAGRALRSADEDPWSLVGEPLRDQELRDRVGAVLDDVASIIGSEHALTIGDFGFATIESALRTTQEHLAELTQTDTVTVLAPALARLTGLLTEVTDLRVQLAHHRNRQTHKRYDAVRNALSRLQGVKSIEQMLDRAPAALCRCGFDRVIISRIAESTWTVERVYVHSDPEWANTIAQAGLDHPIRIDHRLVEGRMVRRRTPILVEDVQSNPLTNAAIRAASLSRSYVAAPIMADGRVIGMLHADCYNSRRHVDRDDLAVLGLFAEGFGYALGRAALIERLHLARNEIQRMARDVANAADSLCATDIAFGQPRSRGESQSEPTPLAAPSLAPSTRIEALLSRRERDVLSLMTQGKSNSDIATHLVIAEGTVKTHVKNVLRKLKASNRAEAVFRYMRMAALEGTG